MPRPRSGLRAEILLALFVAVVLAFGMLDAAVVRLGERARAEERLASARATAALLASVAGSPWIDRVRFDRLAESTLGRGGVVAIEIVRGRETAFARGAPGRGSVVEAAGEAGVVARLYVNLEDSRAGRRQAEFLFLYVALTGGTILVLMYVTLTFLVVRPIDRLTRASARLAQQQLVTRVDESGPAELALLARTFNGMASDLRADREQLVQRLQQIEAATRELRDAQDQIVRTEKLASVGRLSAGVAHEIGNPLAAILGLVELLEGGDLTPEETREFITRIRSETERIHTILRELLDFSRQGTTEAEGEAGRCDAATVARETLALVKPQKAFRAVGLELHAEPVPPVAISDARLSQVLLNLVLNAADAIAGEGTVHVRVEREGDVARIDVDDDGPGIDPSVVGKLFEPFVTTKPVGQGTGLGLAVCHTIVQRAGGQLEASNLEPRGARFTVRLPLASQAA